MARAQEATTITIQLQASQGNVESVFSLTEKSAQKLGRAIESALNVNTTNTKNSLKAIDSDLVALANKATAVRNAFKEMSNFPYKNTTNNISSITREMGALGTKADSTATKLKNVKFLIGDTNKNIKSVINQLDILEKKAASVGSKTISIKTNVDKASLDKAAKDIQTATAPKTSASSPTIIGRNAETMTPAQLSSLQKQQAADQKRLEQEWAKSSVNPNLPKTYVPQSKEQIEAMKQIAGQATITSKTVVDSAVRAQTNFSGEFRKIRDSVADTAMDSRSRFAEIFSANFFAGVAYNAVSSLLRGLREISIETVKYAARTEELGVALGSLARVNGISTETIVEQEVAIKRLNITTQDTRETLARFINVGFDVNKASPLARVAQDLAVIGNKSTSEELNQLTIAIQTLQSRNLRSAGVFLTVDEVLDKLSATTGRARDSFTTLEKQQAVLDATLQYGAKVAGTYDAAMTTVSKRMRSLERNFYEAQNALGEAFIPALGLAVDGATVLLQTVAKFPSIFTGALNVIGLFTAALIALKTQAIQGLVSGFVGVFDAAKGTANAAFGTNFNTLQSQKNALLLEEANLRKIDLSIQSAQLETQIASMRNEVVLLERGVERNSLEEQRLLTLNLQLAVERQIAVQKGLQATETQIANKGALPVSAGSGVAGFLGKAGIIATVVYGLYEIAHAVKAVTEAPKNLTNLDLSAATKNANDLNNLIEYREALEKASTAEGENQNELAKKTAEIYSNLDVTLKARLNTEIGIVDVNTNKVTLAQKELDLLSQQKLILEDIKKAKIVEGVSNLDAAVENYDAKKKSLLAYQAALVKAQEAVKQGFSKSFFGDIPATIPGEQKYEQGPLSYLTNAFVYGAQSIVSDFAPEFHATGASGNKVDAARNFEFIKQKASETGKSLEEMQAQVTSAATDLEKLAKIYGEPNVDKFILSQYSVSDAFRESVESGKQFTGTLTDQDQKAQILIDSLTQLKARQAQLAVAASSNDLAGRTESFGKSFGLEREKFIQNAQKELEKKQDQYELSGGKDYKYFNRGAVGDDRYATEEGQKILTNSKRLFEAGAVAKESFDQYKKDLEQALTSDFVTNFAQNSDTITDKMVATQDVVGKIDELRAGNQKTIADLTAQGITNLDKEGTAKLKNAQNTEDLFNSLQKYNQTSKISQTVTEGVEEALLGMSKALFDANKAYDEFFGKSAKFVEFDSEALRKNKLTQLGEQAATSAGLLGYSGEDIKKFKDDAKTLSPQDSENYFKQLNNFFGQQQQTKDNLDEVNKLREGKSQELKTSERLLEVEQARENLRKARDPNIELALIEKQTDLAQAQEKLRQAKDPQFFDLDTQIKIVEAQAQLVEAKRQKDPTLENLERELKIVNAVKDAKLEQKNVEDDIAILKQTTLLPAVAAELLAQKQILEFVNERKKAEQQLTADIAVELSKRKNYNELSERSLQQTQAEVYLDRLKGEGEALKGLAKSYFNLQFDLGDQSYKENPLVQNAEEQSKKLDETVKNQDIHILATRRTNEILETNIASRLDQANENSYKLGVELNSGNNAILKTLGDLINVVQTQASFGGDFSGTGGISINRTISDAERKQVANRVLKTLMSANASETEIRAIFAAAFNESSFNPNAVGDDGRSHGLYQQQSHFINRFYGGQDLRKNVEASTIGILKEARIAASSNPAKYANNPGLLAADFERPSEQYRGNYARLLPSADKAIKEARARLGAVSAGVAAVAGTSEISSYKAEQLAPYEVSNKVANAEKVATELNALLARQQEEESKAKEAQAKFINYLTNQPGLVGSTTVKAQALTELLNQASPNEVNKLQNINAILGSDDFGISVSSFVDVGNGMAEMVEKTVSLRQEIKDRKIEEAIADNDKRLNERALFGTSLQALSVGFSLDEYGSLGGDAAGYKSRIVPYVNSKEFEQKTDAQKEVILNYYKTTADAAQDRAKKIEELSQKEANSEFYWFNLRKKVAEEFNVSRKEDEQKTDEDIERLNQEAFYRTSDRQRYLSELYRKDEVEKRNQANALQDELEVLRHLDETNYYGSVQYKKQIDAEYEKDYFGKRKDLLTSILRIQTESANLEKEQNLTNLELLENRLRLKNVQINQEREIRDLLKQQQENEQKLSQSDIFNPEKFRTDAQTHLVDSVKSTTDIVTGLFNDSFDAVSDLFGASIDRMTAKLGVFGKVIGNFLKGLISRPLENLFGSLLDKLVPRNKRLNDAEKPKQSATEAALSALGLGKDEALPFTALNTQVAISTTNFLTLNGAMQVFIGVLNSAVGSLAGIAGAGGSAISGLKSVGLGGVLVTGEQVKTAGILGNLATSVNGANNPVRQGSTALGAHVGGGLFNSGLSSYVSSAQGQLGQVAQGIGSIEEPKPFSFQHSPFISPRETLSHGGSFAAPSALNLLHESLNTQQQVEKTTSAGSSILTNFANAIPSIGTSLGASFGNSLGGTSPIGGLLGQVGGGIGGLIGGTALLSILGGTGLFGTAAIAATATSAAVPATGLSAIGGLLGISGAATFGIGLAIAGAFLIGSYLFGRAKRRKEEKKQVTQLSGDALKQLQDLLKAVQSDKIDGADAIAQAEQIRKDFVTQTSKLKTKPGKKLAAQQLLSIDGVITQIRDAAEAQKRRQELDLKITPTYATGGVVGDHNLVRVSRGERLYHPMAAGVMGEAFNMAKIPGFAGGGYSFGVPSVKIPGVFDGKDDIYMALPKGTIIATPAQEATVRSVSGYASGGVIGTVAPNAAQPRVSVSPPPVNAIIVLSKEEAIALAAHIPDAQIVDRVRNHVRKTKAGGLAGDVAKALNY